jgi:hypothetical protein
MECFHLLSLSDFSSAWSLATGSLPQCSWKPFLPIKPAIITDIEDTPWTIHADDGRLPMRKSSGRRVTQLGTIRKRAFEQPSNVRSVFKCFCELSELAHESLYVLYSPSTPLTSRDLLDVYTKYLHWYGSLPQAFRLGENFTPAVLFAQ